MNAKVTKVCEEIISTREIVTYNALKDICNNAADEETKVYESSENAIREAYLTIVLKTYHKLLQNSSQINTKEQEGAFYRAIDK